ncbi:hypothetical protein CHELA20_10966 [Hyphomicrobiales bacterium]|nr:hypothetical protein CHELA20_10966 [Hyphomicrobiales bacterium]CAH1694435.1 hypothetical protein CHELA41_51197 [Hyphomicrobiales bacterium]
MIICQYSSWLGGWLIAEAIGEPWGSIRELQLLGKLPRSVCPPRRWPLRSVKDRYLPRC